MTILFLLFIALAASAFYLSLKHQSWRNKPLPKSVRILAVFFLIIALCCGLRVFSLGTALFAIIAIGILLLSLFPFISLLKPASIKKGENDGH